MSYASIVDGNNSLPQAKSLKIVSTAVNTTSQCSSIDRQPLIFILNDDCLENICRKLPITDRINFALSCERFFNVMSIISKTEHVYLNTDNFYHWPPNTIKDFLRVVGHQVKILDIMYMPKELELKDFGSFCRNVKKLKTSCSVADGNSVKLLIDNMKSLESLEVCSSIRDDGFFKFLMQFKYLKNLHMAGNQNITGENIELLTGLERLSLRACFGLVSKNFQDICTNLKKLRQLDIMYTDCLRPGDCALIKKNLLQLENLKLTCSHDDIICLAELPKLKKLEIQTDMPKLDFFKKLAQLRSNQLEELILHAYMIDEDVIFAVSELKKLKSLCIDVRSNLCDEYLAMISKITELEELKLSMCYTISDGSVLDILEKCLKLKQLDLERCDHLTPCLLKDMIELLIKQHTEHLRKDRLFFTGTFSLWHNKFNENLHLADNYSDLIKVSLEEDNGGMCDYADEYLDNEYYLNWE